MSTALTLSPAAAKRVGWIAERQGKPAILRLTVEGGGCSGFQYRFDLTDAAENDDVVSETDGVRLVVDPVSLDLVAGSTVDFVESLGGASFKVKNPNATAGSGSGSSFGI
jgi:iron-sulfur cluster assembly accessory protein